MILELNALIFSGCALTGLGLVLLALGVAS